MICILGVGDPCLWDLGILGGQAADVMGRDAVSETWRRRNGNSSLVVSGFIVAQ